MFARQQYSSDSMEIPNHAFARGLGSPRLVLPASVSLRPVAHGRCPTATQTDARCLPVGPLSVFVRYLQQAQLRERRGCTSGEVISPVNADLSLLPPVSIHVSSEELLFLDAELMAQRLCAAGVRCEGKRSAISATSSKKSPPHPTSYPNAATTRPAAKVCRRAAAAARCTSREVGCATNDALTATSNPVNRLLQTGQVGNTLSTTATSAQETRKV
jgi:hypothetical protein